MRRFTAALLLAAAATLTAVQGAAAMTVADGSSPDGGVGCCQPN